MTEFNPKVSLFKNAKTSTPYPAALNLSDMLGFIHSGTYEKQILELRAASSEQAVELKKKLQAVTWSGEFLKRNKDAENLKAYSQVICHDIDKLQPAALKKIKKQVCDCTYTLACFVSPSGNGLKILFRVSTGSAEHEPAFIAIGNYLHEQFGIIYDDKTKDVSRLCFVSHDPELYLNPDATIIDTEFVDRYASTQQQAARMPADPAVVVNVAPGTAALLQKCHQITQKTVRAERGSYNKYTNVFSLQANRYGIDMQECLQELLTYCHEHDGKETAATVKNVYERNSSEHGKWKDSGPQQNRKKASTNNSDPVRKSDRKTHQYDDSVIFWYKVARANKDTGEVNGEEYKYSYDDAIVFLENNGFFKYRMDNNRYQLIRVDRFNNMVEIVTELQVKEFMLGFLKSDDSQEYKRVREMFRRGAKNYCGTNILEGLDYYKPDLKRDEAGVAYVYFNNKYLEITAGGIQMREYSDLKGFIWKKQVLDHTFDQLDYQECDFNRFLWYAITGRRESMSEPTDQETLMYRSVCTSIGYLLHRYKSPAMTKAVISVDKKIRRTGEANGRSGKSLFSKALGKMLNMVIIDGPNFKFDYEFAFQQVNIDTELINFNDVTKNFDFSRLFGMITEEFTFNKKKMDSVTIPFADAPKFYISTNYTLKGDGESNKGRQQIIEFSNYFNSENTPAKEFGRMFFHDWDNDEWSRFYCFMVHCVKLYLERGLIDFPLENYGVNKLIDTAGEDFVDYMDDCVLHNMGYVKEHEADLLFEKFRTGDGRQLQHLRKNTFTKWVKMWAEINNLAINAQKHGERDRRNGKDYLTFTEIEPVPAQANLFEELKPGELPKGF